MRRRAFIALAVLAISRPGIAAEDRPIARIAVDFDGAEQGSTWFAVALEETVEREIGRFHHIQLAERISPHTCPERETRCLVDAYGRAGVAVVILGGIRGTKLRYEAYETSTHASAFEGSLAIDGVTRTMLERRIGDIVRPIVQHGGILDRGAPDPKIDAQKRAGPAADLGLVPPALLVSIALLALPCLLLRFGLRRRDIRPSSWKGSIALASLLAILAVAIGLTKIFGIPALGGGAEVVLAIGAGIAWAAFLLTNLGFVFAPLHGLSRVRHQALLPLIRAWLMLSMLRALLFALIFGPIAILTLLVCRGALIGERETYAVIMPAVGLGADFWLLSLVDNLAAVLDEKLILGPATERNPWHATIKRYFLGYVRRLGVELDPDLVERTLFLPSSIPFVASYGGGFSRPRILVGEKIREAALGGLPDENELPERTVNPDELPDGILIPALDDTTKRDHRAQEARRVRLTKSPSRARGAMPRLLGEHATLLGWVIPQAGDQSVPLIANTREDYEVLKKLLTNHYSIFEKNEDDDEPDDTDPSQLDLLFGALLREIGAAKRGDTMLSTVRLAFLVASEKASRISKLVLRAPILLYARFLFSPASTIADSYAALNLGLHHLIQYLYFVRGEEALLTARADIPRLIRTSREILDRTKDDRRLLWLSQFFSRPLALGGDRRVRIAAWVALALATTAFVSSAVHDAIAYHPAYVTRMKASTEGASSDDRATRKP